MAEVTFTPVEWRTEVWRLCGGRCVMTGVKVKASSGSWTWQSHHVVPKRKLPVDLVWEPRLGVVLLTTVHARHTGAYERVPRERIPLHVREFIGELGDPFLLWFEHEHPELSWSS